MEKLASSNIAAAMTMQLTCWQAPAIAELLGLRFDDAGEIVPSVDDDFDAIGGSEMNVGKKEGKEEGEITDDEPVVSRISHPFPASFSPIL